MQHWLNFFHISGIDQSHEAGIGDRNENTGAILLRSGVYDLNFLTKVHLVFQRAV